MHDGSKVSKGLKLSSKSFTYDCTILIKALKDNFSIKASVPSAGSFFFSKSIYSLYLKRVYE